MLQLFIIFTIIMQLGISIINDCLILKRSNYLFMFFLFTNFNIGFIVLFYGMIKFNCTRCNDIVETFYAIQFYGCLNLDVAACHDELGNYSINYE